MILALEKLKQRIPDVIAAAIRARQSIDDVRTCPVTLGNPCSPPPRQNDPCWRVLPRGTLWGEHNNGNTPAAPLLPWNVPADGGSSHWLQATLNIPRAWQEQQVLLALEWQEQRQASLEAILSVDGHELAGIDNYHRAVLLPAHLHRGSHTLLLRCHLPYPQFFEGLTLCLRDTHIFRLGQMMRAWLHVVETCAPHDPLHHTMLKYLNDAYNLLDLRHGWQSDEFAASAYNALEMFTYTLSEGLECGQRPTLIATGHAHLDMAWLWPLWRTRQKAVHTVATALHLMEHYPDYHFSMSQPQIYAYLQEDAPNLYRRLRERAAEGRFEPVGMMWVEADCNLPSGESLIRQLLHGARFFAETFGRMQHVVWLPDSFGYSAALPQILRGCDIHCFVTTKLSWNQFNRMPADTFRWRGIDGSEVLAHLLTAPSNHPADEGATVPCSTYNGDMSAAQVVGTWTNYRQQALNDELLYLYGYGNGGGGPTEEMLEAAHIFGMLPSLPKVQHGRIEQFFERLYERVWNNPDLPTWVGELYLELHRGTYTSQAHTKQANRKAELTYREAEWLNAWATTLGAPDQQELLNEGWRRILLNQFHDILPGSSIALVYQESQKDYTDINTIRYRVHNQALAAIFPDIVRDAGQMPVDVYALNSLPWARSDIISVTVGEQITESLHVVDATGTPLVSQITHIGPIPMQLIAMPSVPAYGYQRLTIHASPAPAVSSTLRVTQKTLENEWLYLELDDQGEIVSLYDKEDERELIAPGATGNQLIAYEDRPLNWEAWDIDPFYEEKPTHLHDILAWRVVEQGPLRAAIEIVRPVGQSTLRQCICIWHQTRRIDFMTRIEWNERQTLLRTLFPLNINATTATCEIQFGAIERPTHRNTSWEAARFEVCAHRWVDLGEGGYGVALLNNGKYGHSLHNHVLGLSLLRGATFPDPDADRGIHEFTYSLLPHTGDWRQAGVVRRAYELNVPLSELPIAAAQSRPDRFSFLSTPTDHIVVETIKVAEDGNGLIVRLYEAHNQRGTAVLIFGQPVRAAVEVDLLEREIAPAHVDGQTVSVSVRPFEIKTLRVWLNGS